MECNFSQVNDYQLSTQDLGNCLSVSTELPQDLIPLIFKNLCLDGAIEGFVSFSCSNKFTATVGREILKGKSLLQFFCPGWILMDAKAQGLVIDDEPPLKLKEIGEFYSKNKAEGMLITVRKDDTVNKVISYAEMIGMKILWCVDAHWASQGKSKSHRPAIFNDVAVKETSRRFITTDSVLNTTGKSILAQEEAISEVGGDGIPAFYLYLKAAVCAEKVFGMQMFEKPQTTIWRSSTSAIPYETTKSDRFVFTQKKDGLGGISTIRIYDHAIYNLSQCKAAAWKQL